MEVDLKKEKQKILIKACVAFLCILLIGGGAGVYFVLQKNKTADTAQSESIDSGEESTEEYVMEEIPTGVIYEKIG